MRSNLLKTMKMLAANNYGTVAVAVPSKSYVTSQRLEGRKGVVQELRELNEPFLYSEGSMVLRIGGTNFQFYIHGSDIDTHKLHGPNYSAAIVEGQPSQDFIDMLRPTLRVGENPIRIHI